MTSAGRNVWICAEFSEPARDSQRTGDGRLNGKTRTASINLHGRKGEKAPFMGFLSGFEGRMQQRQRLLKPPFDLLRFPKATDAYDAGNTSPLTSLATSLPPSELFRTFKGTRAGRHICVEVFTFLCSLTRHPGWNYSQINITINSRTFSVSCFQKFYCLYCTKL